MANHYVKAVLAGICISIGCNVYLACDNRYIGAVLFATGLMTILLFELNLYTGKVGYIVNNKPDFIKVVGIILVGNIMGCICTGLCFPSEFATVLCENKLQIPLMDVFCKSIMCGLLMFVAVDAYKQCKTLLPAIFCVATFILSGYEHSIADIAYFIMGRVITLESLIFILIVIVGNAIGGMIIPVTRQLITIQND